MLDLFQSFVDLLLRDGSENTLASAMAYAANAHDLSWFAYLSLTRAGSQPPQLISNYPTGWTSRYMASRYERIDPIVRQAINHSRSFMWGPEFAPLDRSRPEQRLFDEASEFGVKHGFTIPIHDRDGSFAMVTFATNERVNAVCRAVHHNADTLRLLALNFHVFARTRIGAKSAIDHLGLSPRQLECLKWAAQGKSTWEIGRIVGISQRTAVFHLEKAKEKLGVRTISQAVARYANATSRQL